MPLYQIGFFVSGDLVDQVEELIYEVGDGHWSIFYDVKSKETRLAGIYETEDAAREHGVSVKAEIEILTGKIDAEVEELPDVDWKNAYKDHFHAWEFGGLHYVPLWEKDEHSVPEGDAAIYLDPGMAFGTGNHETTRLCIERLVEYADVLKGSGRELDSLAVCDAGCGSGILAISARKLGIVDIIGFDNDPDAVRISEENAELNELKGKIEFIVGDLDSGFCSKSYDLVFANILAAILVQFPNQVLSAVNPRGRVILSGILAKEVHEVKEVYEAELKRMDLAGTLSSNTLGEWADLVVDLG